MSDLENELLRKQKTLKWSITSSFGVSEPKCVKFLGFYFLVLTVSESFEHHKDSLTISLCMNEPVIRLGFLGRRKSFVMIMHPYEKIRFQVQLSAKQM